MATLTLYGSNVADATLTTACAMATQTGGTETTRLSSMAASPANAVAELTSQGISNEAALTTLPAPTGRGWIYYPGTGTFAAGNWSASVAISDAQGPYGIDSLTIRFYQRSGGLYTSIGNAVSSSFTINATRTVVSVPATSLGSSPAFGIGDGLYIDLWVTRNSGINNSTINIYESSSSVAGVASDMQVMTSFFPPVAAPVNVSAYGRDGKVVAYGRDGKVVARSV